MEISPRRIFGRTFLFGVFWVDLLEEIFEEGFGNHPLPLLQLGLLSSLQFWYETKFSVSCFHFVLPCGS